MTDPADMIRIELLPEERELLLKYGYPFPDEKEQLKAFKSSDDIETLLISDFYLNQLIGDLSYSVNKRTKGRTQDELNDLCERLECVQRDGQGELSYWYEYSAGPPPRSAPYGAGVRLP